MTDDVFQYGPARTTLEIGASLDFVCEAGNVSLCPSANIPNSPSSLLSKHGLVSWPILHHSLLLDRNALASVSTCAGGQLCRRKLSANRFKEGRGRRRDY